MAVVLAIGLLVTSYVAQKYRNQRDDLATAWVHSHPEDFPGLAEEVEDD